MGARVPGRRVRGWLESVAVYRDLRVLAVLFLGFASGLPLALTTGTLAIRLSRAGVDLTTIGLFALVGLPYVLKFLWAPVIDRARLPVLTRALGRRRGWTVLVQLVLMAAVVVLGAASPAADPFLVAALALLVAFLSASQDVVIDAYRIDLLADHQQGAGAAMIQTGYRLGMLASGAGALYLADRVSWFWVYAAMAALVLVGLAAILASPEPAGDSESIAERDRRHAASLLSRHPALSAGLAGWLAWARGAVVDPFLDFAGRRGWAVLLLFILLYKLGDAFAAVMANPFYVAMGFTNTEIANVSKVFGLAATLVGVFVGGALVARSGVMRGLLLAGILQMLSNLAFAAQAVVGHDVGFLALTVFLENVSGGMGSAAFVAFLSLLCRAEFTATQYALLSSFMAVGRTVLSSSSGWFAEALGWFDFFVLSTAVALPGLLLLLWMMRHLAPVETRPGPATP